MARIYPNPFNPATRIEYSIPSAGPVRVVIYDVQGRLTRLLVDEVQTTGEHEVLWWGRDDSGAVISSGIYFVRLEFDGDTKTRKLVFLK